MMASTQNPMSCDWRVRTHSWNVPASARRNALTNRGLSEPACMVVGDQLARSIRPISPVEFRIQALAPVTQEEFFLRRKKGVCGSDDGPQRGGHLDNHEHENDGPDVEA